MNKLLAPETTVISPMEGYAARISDALDALAEAGLPTVRVAEAGVLAVLPWLLAASGARTIEAALTDLAKQFEGNDLRQVENGK